MKTIPPPGPHRSWADLLRLVDNVRRLAHDRSLAPDDAMRRIREWFGVDDRMFNDSEDTRSSRYGQTLTLRPGPRRPGRRRDHHSTTPPPHGINELLTLVGGVRRLAFDRSLPPSEALGRIRDAYRDYDRLGGM